jgi:uncharacterized protein YycO
MIKNIIYILVISTGFLILGCGESKISNKSSDKSNRLDTEKSILKASADTMNPYQVFVEKALSYRTQAFRLYEQVRDKDPLSGEDLDKLHHMTLNHLEIKPVLDEYIQKYQYLINEDSSTKYTQKEQLTLLMISLSAMLIRYDNYLVVYKYYNDNTKLREFLNDEDSAYNIPKNTLQDIVNTYNSLSQRDDVKKLIDYYESHIDSYNIETESDPLFLYLYDLITRSPSYQLGFDNSAENTENSIVNIYNIAVDAEDDIQDRIIYELSKGFGNTAGLVATRKGKLYGDEDVANNIRTHIQPGDILLEKTPFRLTDKLIPGHWGHAAVYIGTEDELRELGIWDNEVVQKFHEEIKNGKVIDEALRDGVQLNTIEHFLDIDDLAIMHDKNESLEDKKYRIILTLRELGKEYDFNFDVETSDKIVCSELIYATYFLDWLTTNTVGIYSISPDHVAHKSIEENTQFSIPILYHDGEEITENKKEFMKKLLEDE